MKNLNLIFNLLLYPMLYLYKGLTSILLSIKSNWKALKIKSIILNILFLFSFIFTEANAALCDECPRLSSCNNEKKCGDFSTCTWDGSASECVNAVIPNTPPTADAGADQTVTEGDNVTLDGSGSNDVDGMILSYSWTDGSSTWSGQTPTISTSGWSTGNHTITLTVTDDDSATDTDTVVITVNEAANIPPVADAGSDQTVAVGSNITLDGSGSTDSDGTITSYNWTDGTTTWTGVSPTINGGLAAGTHIITLTVTDNDSDTDTDTVVIAVIAAGGNTPPTANNDTYTTPFETTLTGNVLSNDDGDTLTIDSNTDVSHGTLTLNDDGSFTYTPNNGYEGADSFTYTISDGNGEEDDATVNITIEEYTSIPFYQNEYSCGTFGSLLTTYDYLDLGENGHPKVCGSASIAYPENGASGPLNCNEDYVECPSGGSGTFIPCERINPPTNRYSHDFPTNERSTIDEGSLSGTLTNLAYGNFTAGNTIFDPGSTYSDNTTPLMILGDVTTGGNLQFYPGDYYFNSLTINNRDTISLLGSGVVRIFVKEDFTIVKNGSDVNKDGLSSNLFIYVNGDLSLSGSGGGNYEIHAYFYVEGTVTANPNSNVIVQGGITAEGQINIGGNNMGFEAGDGAGNFGLGECTLCFHEPVLFAEVVSTEIENKSGDPITELVVSKAYANSLTSSGYIAYDQGIDSDNVGATASQDASIDIDFDGLSNFANPSTAKGFVYDIGDYTNTQADTLYDGTNIPFDIADYNSSDPAMIKAIYIGDYVDGDRNYHVILDSCELFGTTHAFLAGPFVAWDTFRNIDNQQISTKVAQKEFNIVIASLDESGIGLEVKPGIDIRYYLIDNVGTPFSGPHQYDPTIDKSITSDAFTITNAYRDARVRFEVCADYDGTVHVLQPYDNCTDVCNNLNEITNENPCLRHWDQSTDNFAIRPKTFDVNITGNPKFIAQNSNALQFLALNEIGVANGMNAQIANATPDYNESEPGSFTVDLNLGLANGNCQHDSANISPNINFTNGVVQDDFTFDRVGEWNLTISEVSSSASRFAGVDATDTVVLPEWPNPDDAVNNLSIESKTVQLTVIPDHFSISGDFKDHHNGTDQNFTYLSDFNSPNGTAMTAEYNLTITAKKADDSIAENYASGCFAKDVNIDISYETIDTAGNSIDLTGWGLNDIQYFDKITASTVSSSALDDNISYSLLATDFSDTDTNGTALVQININFDRQESQAVNPFKLKLLDILLQDIDGVNNTQTIDQNATYFYASLQSTDVDAFFEDIIDSSIATPVRIILYCNQMSSLVSCSSYGIDTSPAPTGGETYDSDWFISLNHNSLNADGNFSLMAQDPVLIEGVGNPKVGIPASGYASNPDAFNFTINSVDNGLHGSVTVDSNSPTSLPMTVGIEIARDGGGTSEPYITSEWLIHNPTGVTPLPKLYKVRFIGGPAGWAGLGKTGHVIDINNSSAKTNRMNW